MRFSIAFLALALTKTAFAAETTCPFVEVETMLTENGESPCNDNTLNAFMNQLSKKLNKSLEENGYDPVEFKRVKRRKLRGGDPEAPFDFDTNERHLSYHCSWGWGSCGRRRFLLDGEKDEHRNLGKKQDDDKVYSEMTRLCNQELELFYKENIPEETCRGAFQKAACQVFTQ